MELISPLRFVAIACGISILIFSFFRLRSYVNNRPDLWLLILFGSGLTIVGLFPGIISFPSEILSLDDQHGGRLFTLLIGSNIFLWFLLLYQRAKNEGRYFQFDDFVRMLTTQDFFKRNDSLPKDCIIVLIPAFNEADNLKEVLSVMPSTICSKPVVVLVINDGSSDSTASVSIENSALVASHIVNRGGGAALKVGYDIARVSCASVVVTMDADGQHSPEEMERLVKPILENKADFVIGSRVLGHCDDYSRFRILGVHTFSRLISLIIGTKVTDCSSGFRALRGKVIEDCLLLQEQYHTAEVIIDAAKRNFIIVERPITISRRLSGESKKGNDLKYGIFFLRTIIKTWIR